MKIMHSSTTLAQTPQFQLGNKPILRCNICLIVVNYEMPSSPWPGEKAVKFNINAVHLLKRSQKVEMLYFMRGELYCLPSPHCIFEYLKETYLTTKL